MTQQEKILLEQDFEAYSDAVLRIAVQNTKTTMTPRTSFRRSLYGL